MRATEFTTITELSKRTLKSYSREAGHDIHADRRDAQGARDMGNDHQDFGKHQAADQWHDEAEWLDKRAEKRAGNVAKATSKIAMKDVAEEAEQFCENCGGSLSESGKASRQLCKSSRSNADLGVSQLASCKSQGLRARESSKKHEIAGKRASIKGKSIKGHKYGGPLPYNKSDR